MNEELHDIPDPSPLLPGMYVPWYFWVILGFVALALLALILFLVFSRRKQTSDAIIASALTKLSTHVKRRKMPRMFCHCCSGAS